MNTTASKKNVLIVVLIIIVIGLLIWLFMPKTKVEAPVSETATTTPVTSITTTVDKQSSETANYTIDVETPVVVGIADGAVAKSINSQLVAKVNSVISDFKGQAVDNKPIGGPDTKSGLTIDLKSASTTKGVIYTVRLEVSTYFSGAAHPITVSETSNFDLRNGKDLQLIDIFDPNAKSGKNADGSDMNYLYKISTYSTAALKAHLMDAMNISESELDGVFFPEGADSNPENFSRFLLEDGGMRVIFGQYQVAPYAAGEQEVLIPYSELSPYFLKGEPMDTLAR